MFLVLKVRAAFCLAEGGKEMRALVAVFVPKRLDSADLLPQPRAPALCGFCGSCCGLCLFLVVGLEELFVDEGVNVICGQDP